MSQCCGKVPSPNDTEQIRQSIIDLNISDSPDPFKDPVETRKDSNDWWTTKGNHIVVFTDKDGQINYDIVEGPDRGVHRFYDPKNQREGQTGVENLRTGERRHDK